MSIWTDCEEHEGAVPFFGFPVIPSFDGKILTLDFPKGYKPNGGSKTEEVCNLLVKKFGGKPISFDKNKVVVEIDPETVAYILVDIIFS